MTLKQGTDSCSGFILTVEQYSYAIFKIDDQWVLFDSHGCLRQSRSNTTHTISYNYGALIVSVGHLEKLLSILQDTHVGHGQCQVMIVNIAPMVLQKSPVAHDRCSGDRVEPVEATEPQAIALPEVEPDLPESNQVDTAVLPNYTREQVKLFETATVIIYLLKI